MEGWGGGVTGGGRGATRMGVADASGAEQGACPVRPAPSALCGVTSGGAHGCHCAPLRATPSTEKNVPVALELLPPGHEGAKGAAGARGARRAPVHHAAFPCSCGAGGGLLQPPKICADMQDLKVRRPNYRPAAVSGRLLGGGHALLSEGTV
jgi:hypothetical protein